MIQVYVAVRARRQVTIPPAVFDALGLRDDGWLRLTVVDPGRALLERVSETAEPVVMPRAAAGAAASADSPRGGQ
jgi:bifunctional DNA-binding transcriptional regulator/antitoxin component of YhaV-PrlF toxin-antitoxin module